MLDEEIIIQTDGKGGQRQRYIKKQKIGSGGFAKCYLFVNCRTQQKLAAKVIDSKQIRDKTTKSKIMQQIQIHKMLNHPHIVKFHDTFQFEDKIYMVMELCQNNTLKQFIKTRVRITQFEAKCYLHQILDGIQYLHSLNIIHRDIKLGNLFLNIKMQVKIGDFGLSKQLKQPKQRRFTTCGTPNYIAPEILKETGHSFQADIWAVGIILFTMLIGRPPFQSESVQSTYRKIKSNTYEFPKQIPISNQAKNFIRRILDPNPKTRISLQQMRKHDFLNKDVQKIPKTMPPYTISIPPQSNFLKQFINQKSMKLTIYPKRVNDRNNLLLSQEDDKLSKLDRVLSADKKMLMKFQKYKQQSRQISTLNRGRYIKALRAQSLSKSSVKNLKCVRSATSINSIISNNMEKAREKQLSSPKKSEQDLNQIICYYDISDKYGISYLLSNGNYGIVFNDKTSLTAISQEIDSQMSPPLDFIYYDKIPQIHQSFSGSLIKKKDILKICHDKLQNYRKSNILIPYRSQVYVKKCIRLKNGFAMKLSNGIMQFFWDADSVTLRNYKWVRWRINQQQGEGKLNQKNFPNHIRQKIQIVKQFLLMNCLNSKAKNLQKQ